MGGSKRNAFALRTLLAERVQTGSVRHSSAADWIERASSAGLPHVLDFANQNGVAALLARDLLGDSTSTLAAPLQEQLADGLRQARGLHLQQERHALEVGQRLDDAGIPHLFFKGLSLGRRLYPEAALRPSVDLDLLIPKDRREGVLSLFQNSGYTITHHPKVGSHECDVTGTGGTIDLHWALFRPGRSRVPLETELLSRRVQASSLWVPDDADLLLLALVHPALTEHVTGRLLKAVDLDRATRQLAPAWPETLERLERAGLRTAAWAQLTWTRTFFDSPVPIEFEGALEPPGLRVRYLRTWLNRDPAALYAHHPLLVRAGFSLALQESGGDMARALLGYARARL